MPSDADETLTATIVKAEDGGISSHGSNGTVADQQPPTDNDNQPAAATETANASAAPAPSTGSTQPISAAPTIPLPSSSAATTSSSPSPSPATSAPATPAPFPSDGALLSHLQAYLSTADLEVVTTKTIIAHLQTHFQHDLSSKKAIIKAAINDFMSDPHDATAQTADNGTDTHQQPRHDGQPAREEAEPAVLDEPEETEEPEEQLEETQDEIDHRLAMELAAEDSRPRRSAAAQSIKRAAKRKLKETTAATATATKKPKKSSKPPTLYSLSPALSAFLPSQPSHMSWGDVVKALWAYFRAHNLQDERNKKRILLDEPLQSVFGKDRKTMDAFKMNTLLTKHMKKEDELA